MSVGIIDRRIIVDEGDTVTGWTNVGFGTTTSDIAESTAAVAAAVSIGDAPMYYTLGTGVDLTSTLVYVYSFNNALQNNWDNTIPPNGILIGDGTNRIAFHQAGNNRRVFNHLDGPTNWQCLVIDTDELATQDTAGLSFADAGTFASLNTSSITDFGAYHETLSKALGGGYNVACDIIRYGNDGIYIWSGSVGDPGTFNQIAIADRSTTNQAAHGILRELNLSSYGVQGPLTFGVASAASSSYFSDSGISITYENRNISDGKYFFNIEGNSGTTNEFYLTNATLTTAGPSLSVSCSQNIDNLNFSGVFFINLREPITFPTDTITNLATHSITNCSFTNQEEINPGSIVFTNNNILDYTSSLDEGAIIIDENSVVSNWSNLTFTSIGNGHAIYITATGSYTLDSFFYNGYTSGSNGDEEVYNNSGGAVTLNIIGGGDSLNFRNGVGASTIVNNNTSVTITGLRNNTEVRILESGTQNELAGVEDATDGTDDNRSFTFSLAAGLIVDIVIHSLAYVYQRVDEYTIPSSDAFIPITQQLDRNYLNP